MVPALICLCCEQFIDLCPQPLLHGEMPVVPSAPQLDVGG